MPLPKWLARVNRRMINPREIAKGDRPVLAHVGRSSGSTYHTPLDAHQIDGGFLFIMNYGRASDWVKNILAAGSAELRVGDSRYHLVAPRIIGAEEAVALLPRATKMPPGFMNITECLRMDLVSGD